MSIWISILLITICAVCWDVGIVWQKQAADTLPRIEMGKHIFKIIKAFVLSKKWMAGLVISGLGWGLFAFALNYTPVSLARCIQGSGFVILAFFSIFFLDHHLKIREWMGVIIVTCGIIALGLSEPIENQTVSVMVPSQLIPAVGAAIAICFMIYGARKIFSLGFDWLVVFSIFAGVLLGLGDVSTKAVLLCLNDKAYITAFGFIAPWLIVFYLVGFFLLSRGYQQGRALVVTAVSDFCSRLITIFMGVFAMGEAFPQEMLYRDLRIIGLVAILFGAILLARFSGEQLADELAEKMPADIPLGDG
ncbi:MAG: EamA family transporter [Thermodesulfobacteriota bacterium]|nr:EamA family transporter [Thermodesulfobacteriota bacterium]